ncbi:hypothetical protein JOB18_030541 [Solea senegalensis]|uniref:Uncharacterized protein n=1 Tax=Solea senegalensis TaxID=28829 RepID=A0AAV6QEH5_SOLSE|nr:hypothetical protein JOB18_030541 [Solea senegalensis]
MPTVSNRLHPIDYHGVRLGEKSTSITRTQRLQIFLLSKSDGYPPPTPPTPPNPTHKTQPARGPARLLSSFDLQNPRRTRFFVRKETTKQKVQMLQSLS